MYLANIRETFRRFYEGRDDTNDEQKKTNEPPLTKIFKTTVIYLYKTFYAEQVKALSNVARTTLGGQFSKTSSKCVEQKSQILESQYRTENQLLNTQDPLLEQLQTFRVIKCAQYIFDNLKTLFVEESRELLAIFNFQDVPNTSLLHDIDPTGVFKYSSLETIREDKHKSELLASIANSLVGVPDKFSGVDSSLRATLMEYLKRTTDLGEIRALYNSLSESNQNMDVYIENLKNYLEKRRLQSGLSWCARMCAIPTALASVRKLPSQILANYIFGGLEYAPYLQLAMCVGGLGLLYFFGEKADSFSVHSTNTYNFINKLVNSVTTPVKNEQVKQLCKLAPFVLGAMRKESPPLFVKPEDRIKMNYLKKYGLSALKEGMEQNSLLNLAPVPMESQPSKKKLSDE